jgi:hypothetical protein
MPRQSRPLLAVRLIGPAATVTTHATALAAQFTATYGGRATCRTSTHPARHAGEVRVDLTITPKGNT